jgi:hypothetical protein
MGVGSVPFLKVEVGVAVPLLLLRIALPRLIRLFVRALIRPLPGIVFGCFLAHADTSMPSKSLACGFRFQWCWERIQRRLLESRFCGVELFNA